MKKISNSKQLPMLLLIIIAIWPLSSGYGSPPGMPYPYNFTFETVKQPEKAGLVQMKLTLSQKREWCKEVNVSVSTVNGLKYEGELNWSVTLDTLNTYTKVFDVTISDNDTCGILITMSCGRFSHTTQRFFVTTREKVEYFRGDPRGWTPSGNDIRTGPRQGNIIPGEHPYMDSVYGYPIACYGFNSFNIQINSIGRTYKWIMVQPYRTGRRGRPPATEYSVKILSNSQSSHPLKLSWLFLCCRNARRLSQGGW